MNVKNIRKKLQGFVKHEKHETGFLGRADGTVRVPGKLHWVYVRLWNGDVIEAFNNGDVPTAFGLAVEVEYRGSRYYLAPRDSYEQPVFVGLPDGAEDELQWPGLHTLYVRPEQFLPGLVIPKSGLTVIVHGGSLLLAGGGYLIVPTQEIDLTPYVPASNAIWVTLGWSNSGTVLIQTGGAANSIGELSTSNIPATGGFDLAAIKMFNGQTSISHGKFGSMITDLRFFKPSSSSGEGIFRDGRQVVFYDEFLTTDALYTTGEAINGGTTRQTNGSATEVGVIALNSSETADGGYRFTTHSSTSAGLANILQDGNVFTAKILQEYSTGVTVRIGFHNTVSVTAPTDGAYFEIVGGIAKGACSSGGGNSYTVNTYALALSTWYTVKVEIQSGSAVFKIFDTSGVELFNESLSSNIPTNAVGWGAVATESSTTARNGILILDYMRVDL